MTAVEGRGDVAETWALRASAEVEAVERFARLADRLAAHGAAGPVVGAARSAVREERFHSRLCARMARRYGHPTGFGELPHGPEDAVGHWPPEMPARDRLLFEVTAMCCLTESLNACLLSATYEAARVPLVRRVVRRILVDEMKHSRLGWAYLDDERKRRDCRGIAGFLPQMLEASVREELFFPPPPDPDDEERIHHGEIPAERRLELFGTALREVVFPGFESLGIDSEPASAWLESKSRA